MGLQTTKIDFVKKAEETVRMLQRGSVAILLKANSSNVYTFKNFDEAEKKLKTDKVTLTEDGNKALELVFRGSINRPYRVYVAFCNEENSINESIQAFEGIKFDWFCAPEFTTKHSDIANWINTLDVERNMEVKAVVSGVASDSEYVVNFTGNKIALKDLGGKKNVEVTSSIFTARVASALAGTPLTRSITNLELEDVSSVERLSNDAYDSKIEAGELVIFNDWDKVRFGRGVTSLTTVGDKSEERKKILIVSKMHMWKREVKAMINDQYLGARQNTINEKMLLITSIKQYNDELAKKGVILNDASVDIDVRAQEKFLKEQKNIDTSNMSEKEIRDAKTDSYVFIKADLSFTDAMEDISVTVSC